MKIHDIMSHTYLVGGAVRDQHLNIAIKDRDWVVVGITPSQMLKAGFKQVGADFPVFLHPHTQEEYALARTERKEGSGYAGFACYAGLDVTLPEDLKRRDLTINAMALSHQGELIDPYHGQADLDNKVLRHVSDAFEEDPLRVLRVARFAARFAHLGFRIADETKTLMQKLSRSGELNTLTAERVWQETERALSENSAYVYFETLKETNALVAILPEIDALYGIEQPAKYHPEIDTGIHTILTLKRACELSDDTSIRWAALLHDLGKALSPKEHLPSHHGHEKTGIPLVRNVCDRFKVPTKHKKLALLVCEFHLHTHKAFELKPQTILKVLQASDAWRNPERWEAFLICCQADSQGRTGLEHKHYPQIDYLRQAFNVTQAVDAQAFIEQGMKGIEIKNAIDQARIQALSVLKTSWQSAL